MRNPNKNLNLYLMINLPKYVRNVSDFEIDVVAERIGYQGYIPYPIVRDLMAIRVGHIIHEGVIDVRPTAYSTTLISLYNTFSDEIIRQLDLIEFAVNLLKLVSPRVNLRELERGISSQHPIMMDISDSQVNYRDDLSTINKEYLEFLGVDMSVPVNEIVLTPEVYDIIHFYNGLKQISGELYPTKRISRSKMTKVSDAHKVRKYRFAMPSFMSDIALKKLTIKTIEVETKQNNSVVVMVDVSWSTTMHPTYFSMVRAVMFSLMDSFVDNRTSVEVLEFFNSPSRELTINTKDELLGYIGHKIKPVLGSTGWAGMGRYMGKYAGKTIILVTDGDLTITHVPDDIKLYIVSSSYNPKLAAVSFNSGGKFVIV